MMKRFWIFFFVLALVVHLAGMLIPEPDVAFFSKPLIVFALGGYFIAAMQRSDLNKWIIGALFFSWAGDILLLFQEKDSLFFLLGLSAFLLAHIFYIIFFQSIRIREAIIARWWWLLIVAVYYAGLIFLLANQLGDMELPVKVYGIVISSMCMLALHMPYLANRKAGRSMMAGALLFVISDSVLAINKFYEPFDAAGPVIMLTYGLAQFFIVQGAISYTASVNRE